MNKVFVILIFSIFLSNCSLNENSRIWNKKEKIENENKVSKKILTEKEIISTEFNPLLKLDLSKNKQNNKIFDPLNNFGSSKYNGQLNKVNQYKFSKLENFNQFNFEEKYKAIIPIYKEDDKYLIQDKIQKHKNITFANVESSEILKKAKAAVVCSGTATLEALLAEVPTTVIYKTNWFNHLVLKNLMMSEFVSIPNIIADEEIFFELLQSNATSENIAHDLNSNLADYEFRKEMIQAVKAKLEKTNLESFCNRLYEDCRS